MVTGIALHGRLRNREGAGTAFGDKPLAMPEELGRESSTFLVL
jgi:hypothetical protein